MGQLRTALVNTAAEIHVVLPGDVDDTAVPSGGNTYDRRVCQGLAAMGWQVHETAVPGAWPQPGPAAGAELARSLAALPDGAAVLLDGLVACGVPEIVVPHGRRLRLAVLVHMPLAEERGLAPTAAADLEALEQETLSAASAVVATSPWTARRLVRRHGLADHRVHVAAPGTDPAPLAPGTDGASQLLCVAAVTPTKGHDLLVEALATLTDLPWTCMCVGALRRDPAYAARVRQRIARLGLGERVPLSGPLPDERLAAEYAAADLVVLASRTESYGMVVAEALARGIPVLAAAVDGVPETLGGAPGGPAPGILVPPEDSGAIAAGLRRWFADPELRRRLKASAQHRRTTLTGWEKTTRQLASALEVLVKKSV